MTATPCLALNFVFLTVALAMIAASPLRRVPLHAPGSPLLLTALPMVASIHLPVAGMRAIARALP